MPETVPAQTPSAPVRLNDLLCFAVYAANNAFNRFYKPLMSELGLTYPQFLVLIALWETDGQSVGQLGERLGLESNTLTPLLKRMEGAGLVSRNRDPKDERRVCVMLTATGRALEATANGKTECVAAATGMKKAEIAELRTALERLRQNLGEALAD